MKKVKGQFAYFGKVSDDTRGERALALWLEQKDELLAGRKPSKDTTGKLTVRELVNAFLDEKERLRASGEISRGRSPNTTPPVDGWRTFSVARRRSSH